MFYVAAIVCSLFVVQWQVVGCSDKVSSQDGGDGGILPDIGTSDAGDAGTGDVGPCPKSNQELRCGICQPKRCVEATQCNPGQVCQSYACIDDYPLCSGGECDTPGMLCVDGKVCKFAKCGVGGKCPDGQSCFNTYCIEELPCGISSGTWCSSTEVCLTPSNACVPAPAIGGCDVVCPAGQVRVFTDPDTSAYSTCTQIACSCESLPDIPLGQYGYYSAIVLKGGEPYAAAYNKTYGDLVVLKFAFDDSAMPEAAQADPKSIQFVDGVPATGVIGGNPNGPRKGIVTPGPNVGWYPSIGLAADGNIAIAYYDVNDGATVPVTTARLKYAKSDGTNWTTHVVDGADIPDGTDVGRYASLSFDKDGKPNIAYFQKTGPNGPDHLTSALKVAIAKSANPTSKADWDFVVVETAPVSCRAYDANEKNCALDEACVDIGKIGSCAKTAGSACAADGGPGDCGKDKVCVLDPTSKPVCATPLKNGVPEIPEGTGMFPSLVAAADGNDYVAFYDHAPVTLTTFNGNLKTAVVKLGSASVIAIVDGVDDKGVKTADVGRFASMAQDSGGGFGISYFDATYSRLKYWSGSIGQPGTKEIVMTGVSPGQKDFVGPDCSLAFDASKVARIAFQDATTHRLMYAVRNTKEDPWPAANLFILMDPTNAKQQARFGTGGYGFFAKQRFDGSISWIVNMKIGYKVLGDAGEYQQDNRLILFKKSM
jgi:hypothetical protein